MRDWKASEMQDFSLDWIRGPGSRLDWEWSRTVLHRMIWRNASTAAMARGEGTWGEGWGLEGLGVWMPIRRGSGEGEVTAKLAVNPDLVRRVLSRMEERDSSESGRRFWDDRSEMQMNKCWVPRNGSGKYPTNVTAFGTEQVSRREFMLVWGGLWIGTRSMTLLRPPGMKTADGEDCLPGCLCPWEGHLRWVARKPRNLVSGRMGICPYGHRYVPLLTRNGKRRGCPECNRVRSAEAAEVVREAAHAAGITAAEFRRGYGGTSAARKFLEQQGKDPEEVRKEFLAAAMRQAEADQAAEDAAEAAAAEKEDSFTAPEPVYAAAEPVTVEAAIPWYLAPSMVGSTEEESEARRMREHEATRAAAAAQEQAAAREAAGAAAATARALEVAAAAEIVRARLNAVKLETEARHESG